MSAWHFAQATCQHQLGRLQHGFGIFANWMKVRWLSGVSLCAANESTSSSTDAVIHIFCSIRAGATAKRLEPAPITNLRSRKMQFHSIVFSANGIFIFRSFHQHQNSECRKCIYYVSCVLRSGAGMWHFFLPVHQFSFFVCDFRQAITLLAYEWIHPAMQQRNAIDNGFAGVMLMKMPCKIWTNRNKSRSGHRFIMWGELLSERMSHAHVVCIFGDVIIEWKCQSK